MAVEWVIAAALIAIALILFETRLTVGTRFIVMERDLRWITAALQKWGIVPPKIDKEP
jgi:hypothetical protein